MVQRRTALGATTLAVALGTTLALAPATTAAPSAERAAPHHKVVVSGLDNPRQLTTLPDGSLLVAEAGHGADPDDQPGDCSGTGEDMQCVGDSGQVSRVTRKGGHHEVVDDLFSMAGADGSFATGADGADKLGNTVYVIVTAGPPEATSVDDAGKQAGYLMRSVNGGPLKRFANVAKFERKHDVDNEGVESNPYSVLALNKNKILVADAAGDYIARVNRLGKVSVWHKMKEYGAKVDAVPTVLTEGPDGTVYVGELHSEKPGKARVWQLNRKGKVLNHWKGFTTVTGVAVAKNGTMYVSELFGGSCGFPDIPTCFPGRVTRVRPNGKKKSVAVPFPAGVAVSGRRVYVNAFSISPGTGFGGNPAWSGQLWRIFK